MDRRHIRNRFAGSQRLWIVAAVAAMLFVILGVAVASGSSLINLDRSLSEGLDRAATPGWIRVFRVVTLLGTGEALGIASAIVGIGLLMYRQFALAVGWTVAQVGAAVLVKGVKFLVERDRPGLGDIEFYAHGWSFPSGHVVRTFVFCGMAAYLVFRLSGSRRATMAACGLGLGFSLVMAFSRVYLGAHYPSDVVGALMLASAWLAACVAALDARKSSRDLE